MLPPSTSSSLLSVKLPPSIRVAPRVRSNRTLFRSHKAFRLISGNGKRLLTYNDEKDNKLIKTGYATTYRPRKNLIDFISTPTEFIKATELCGAHEKVCYFLRFPVISTPAEVMSGKLGHADNIRHF